MSKIILCTSKTAETPFTFLNTKVEIYTYEELCFYIYNNTVLISKSALSDKLFEWIRVELGMEDLADRLVGLMNKSTYAQDLLIEILSEGNYYTTEEIKNYAEAWQKYRKLDKLQKAKLKADGIPSMVYYIKPMHLQGAYAGTDSAIADCPVTERLAKTVLSLPLHPYMEAKDVSFVVEKLKAAIN